MSKERHFPIVFHVLVVLFVLLVAASGVTYYLSASAPEATPVDAVQETMQTENTEAEPAAKPEKLTWKEKRTRKKILNALKDDWQPDRSRNGADALQAAYPELGDDARALLDRMMLECGGSPEILELALIAERLDSEGLGKDYAEGLCRQALENLDYSLITDPYCSSLKDVLKIAPEEILINTFARAIAEMDPSFYGSTLTPPGNHMPSTETTLEIAGMFADNHPLMFKRWCEKLTCQTLAEAIALLSKTSPEHRSALAAVFAEAFTETPDKLAFVRECSALGIKPSEVYPKGILLDGDFSRVASREFSGELPAENTLLIVSRTEKPEPQDGETYYLGEYGFEMNEEAMDQLMSASIEELSSGISYGRYNRSPKFTEDYDGNDKSDPANYTVRIETAYMDKIPAENLPASLEECGYFILLDSLYRFDHTIIMDTVIVDDYLASLTDSAVDSRQKITEFPTYVCDHSVYLCAGESLDIVIKCASLQLFPEDLPSSGIFYSPDINHDYSKYLMGGRHEGWLEFVSDSLLLDMELLDWSIPETAAQLPELLA